MSTVLGTILTLVAAFGVAWVIAYVVIAVLDFVGLVYREPRE